jgi:hypothetical protein
VFFLLFGILFVNFFKASIPASRMIHARHYAYPESNLGIR